MDEPFSKDLVDALKEIVFDCNWQKLAEISKFKPMKCHRLYSLEEGEDDIIVIRDKRDRFYAMDARCPHEGGPLDQGDIEELACRVVVVCPWHLFEFDASTGESSTGLKQTTYATKIVDGWLYVNTPHALSLENPNTNKSSLLAKDESSSQAGSNQAVVYDELTTKISLCDWAVRILNTPDPMEKVRLTTEVAEKWLSNQIDIISHNEVDLKIPDEPARLNSLSVVDPSRIRRGKAGTQSSRVALLHSLANIEQWAIDLSWDIIARFRDFKFDDQSKLPREFFTDFVKVACDEAKHFKLLDARLKELDSYFGALSVHNGLWESATVTKSNFLARLAIVHMVHEARGLDVHPQTRLRFLNNGDADSVKLLDILYEDEITHVAAGIRWFQYTCQKNNLSQIETFHDMVKKYFKGYLKPPFDTSGRTTAGMTQEWYLPLVKPSN